MTMGSPSASERERSVALLLFILHMDVYFMPYERVSETAIVAHVHYQPWSRSGLTHAFASHNAAGQTPAAWSISNFDCFEAISQPFTHDLPHVIMEIIAADPTSSVAVKYRKYIKTVLLPLCQRVTGVLTAH